MLIFAANIEMHPMDQRNSKLFFLPLVPRQTELLVRGTSRYNLAGGARDCSGYQPYICPSSRGS
jgi:hypothetical protein